MSFGKTVKPNSLFGQSNLGGNQQQNSSLLGGQTIPQSTNSLFGGQTTNSAFGDLTKSTNSVFGSQTTNSVFGDPTKSTNPVFGGQTTQPTNSVVGQATQPTNSLFGGQATQPTNSVVSQARQPTNSLFGGQTTQPTNSLFGVQQPSNNSIVGGQTNPQSTLLNEQVTQNLVIQTILELSRKVEALSEQVKNLSLPPSTSNNEKKILVACNHHEHILYETTPEKITGLLNSHPSTILEKNSYINGFKCDVCGVDYKPQTHMYHCEMCEQTNKLYDICENCIRKSLKLV